MWRKKSSKIKCQPLLRGMFEKWTISRRQVGAASPLSIIVFVIWVTTISLSGDWCVCVNKAAIQKLLIDIHVCKHVCACVCVFVFYLCCTTSCTRFSLCLSPTLFYLHHTFNDYSYSCPNVYLCVCVQPCMFLHTWVCLCVLDVIHGLYHNVQCVCFNMQVFVFDLHRRWKNLIVSSRILIPGGCRENVILDPFVVNREFQRSCIIR